MPDLVLKLIISVDSTTVLLRLVLVLHLFNRWQNPSTFRYLSGITKLVSDGNEIWIQASSFHFLTQISGCVSSSASSCLVLKLVQLLSHVRLCNPMDCSTPGFPVHHQLPELAQIHVHRVSDAIKPPHSLSSLSPPAFNLSQHQGLLQWVSSSYHVAKVLEFQLQNQLFQWIFKTEFLYDGLVGSPSVQGTLKSLLQHHNSKHQFFGAQLSLWFNSHIHTWLLENHSLD